MDSKRKFLSPALLTFVERARPSAEHVRALAKKLRQRSILGRMIVLLLGGAAIIYLIAVFSIWFTSAKLVNANLERFALQWVAELDKLGAPLYASKQARPSTLIEERINSFPEVAYVRYFAQDGNTVLHTYGPLQNRARETLPSKDLKTLSQKANEEHPYVVEHLAQGHLRVVVPVRVKAIRSDGLLTFTLNDPGDEIMRVIGFIELGMDGAFYARQLERGVIRASFVTAFVFLLALVLGRRLIRNALRPLLDLQAPLARLAKGDTNITVLPSGDAEIIAIGNALNATISALRQRDETLRRLAERDSLTGLYNRRYFSLLLEEEITRCQREDATSALLFIDLDRFKVVNDTLGHAAGDRLLVNVADLMKGRMRESDIVCRYAGDEFTIIARNAQLDRAKEIAKSIIDIVSSYVLVEGEQSFAVSCSIGIAGIDARSTSAEDALARADSACFEAKAAGRNRCMVHQDAEEAAFGETRNWPELIQRALKQDGFRLVYQPIQALNATCETHAAEVLLRLIDAEGREWLPSAFLSAAERVTLMADIDQHVVKSSAAALAALPKTSQPTRLFVNLSSQIFQDAGMVNFIKTTVLEYGLPPSAFIFEITEQTMVRYIDKARRLMESLIEYGFQFALNDFGMGLTNFAYLKHLPVSFVKIDGALIERLSTQPVDQILVQAIAKAAHALDKMVIAQHVEDADTLQLLREHKVDYVQGHRIAPPGPLDALPATSMTRSQREARGHMKTHG